MKVILVNGSPRPDGCTARALKEVADELGRQGVESEIFRIGTKNQGCIACGTCRKTGKCVFDDAVNAFREKAETADGFVFGSPVYYAGAAGGLIGFLDRLFYSAGAVLADKPAAAVVSCRRGGASTAFGEINKYFQINNMPVVSSNYWNQVHGNTPEEVGKDAEGLQTMRTLAVNLAWLLRSIEAGKKEGIPLPSREKKISTNFIRP